jgi:hypothetical protein
MCLPAVIDVIGYFTVILFTSTSDGYICITIILKYSVPQTLLKKIKQRN